VNPPFSLKLNPSNVEEGRTEERSAEENNTGNEVFSNLINIYTNEALDLERQRASLLLKARSDRRKLESTLVCPIPYSPLWMLTPLKPSLNRPNRPPIGANHETTEADHNPFKQRSM